MKFMPNLKTILSFLILIFTTIVLGQDKDYLDQFMLDLTRKANKYKSEVNFNKAQFFYLNKNWDSTLVYSMKQLSANNKELDDYCHFLRANCFREKALNSAAEKELPLISKKFTFYPLVNYNFGIIAFKTKKYQKAIDYYLIADSALINKPTEVKNINLRCVSFSLFSTLSTEICFCFWATAYFFS